jgi:hypothetical protein
MPSVHKLYTILGAVRAQPYIDPLPRRWLTAGQVPQSTWIPALSQGCPNSLEKGRPG